MAMKQIKLELDNSKFMAIITELQVSTLWNGLTVGSTWSQNRPHRRFLRRFLCWIVCLHLHGIRMSRGFAANVDGWREFG
jgi:hypothetical protein